MRQERLGNTILWRDGDGKLHEEKIRASEFTSPVELRVVLEKPGLREPIMPAGDWFTQRPTASAKLGQSVRRNTMRPPEHRIAALPLVERSVCRSVFKHIEPKEQWELLEYYEKVTKAP